MVGRVSPSRRRRESGSALIEFAFSILPLFAVLFMIMDIAWFIFGWACVQEGVREGVRYGITGSGQSETTLDETIKTIVQRYSYGFAQGNSVAIHYYPPSGYSAAGGPAALDGTAAATSAGNIITVQASRVSLKSFGPIFRAFTTINVSANAADVLQ